MSELFRGGDTLMVYHYMFPRHSGDERPGPTRGAFAERPLNEGPCPSCTALIDMWEGTMPHFEGLGGNLVVAARATVDEVATFAREKGWKHTRLVSAARSSFRRDYGGDGPDGEPVPIMTVFRPMRTESSGCTGQRGRPNADEQIEIAAAVPAALVSNVREARPIAPDRRSAA